jgi:prepilin-type N-terminal cleavage/methylation domain-containing protein
MKNLLKSKRAEGFTIIEVMIVLAIAGLIMVIVFIAVPQLQRNQRDNARQNIANRVKAELETYAGNNQGAYPFGPAATGTGNIGDFVTRYITGKVKVADPTTGADVVDGSAATKGKPIGFGTAPSTTLPTGLTHGQFYVVYGAKCQGEGLAASGSAVVTTRNYAVMIGLDRDGTGYCVDNG